MITKLLPFSIATQQYALDADCVQRVVRAVAITTLSGAPEIVLGIINVHGTIVPVIDMRTRFRLPQKDLDISDVFIIAHSSRRMVALIADTVSPITEYDTEKIIPGRKAIPGLDYIRGIVALEDGVVLIHDLDSFLSLDDEYVLDKSLRKYKNTHQKELK